MTYFSYTFINVILPIFIIIMTGALINTIFHIDIKSLTKLQFYLFMPAMLFLKVYESELSSQVIVTTLSVAILSMLSIFVIAAAIAKIRGYSKPESSVFINSSVYFNAGNFSFPLIKLLFDDPLALSIQAVILMANNVTFFTLGIFTAGSGSRSPKEALLYLLKMPLIYVMALAAAMRSYGMIIADPIIIPLRILTDGYVAVALLTLGAQLSETRFSLSNKRIYITNFLRLLVTPAITYLIVSAMGVQGIMARVLVISLGAPTAVNVALSSIELDNEPEFASQAVFTSTILSMVTIILVIRAAFSLIPV
jgi:hypothetical protein